MIGASIRDATPADVADVMRLTRALAEYERELSAFTATEDDFHRILFGAGPRAYALLAEVPDQPPVGLALYLHTINTFRGQIGLFLEDLFVQPAHRGTGTGLALMRAVAQRAVAEGCNVVEWRVLNWNQPAIDFYQRLGAARMQKWHVRQLGGSALAELAKGAKSDG